LYFFSPSKLCRDKKQKEKHKHRIAENSLIKSNNIDAMLVVISNFDWENVMNFVENYKGKQTQFQDVKISPCQIIVNYLKKYQN